MCPGPTKMCLTQLYKEWRMVPCGVEPDFPCTQPATAMCPGPPPPPQVPCATQPVSPQVPCATQPVSPQVPCATQTATATCPGPQLYCPNPAEKFNSTMPCGFGP